MSGGVTVRRATAADAAALHALTVAAIRRSASEHYTAAQLEAWAGRISVAQLRRVIEVQHALVAESDGTVAGVASIALDPVDGLVRGEVDRLFVHPDHGGRGVAAALLAAVEAAAREAGIRDLETHASWRAAPVFARVGFEQVDVEHVTIDGEELTRARMRKTLAGPGRV